MATDIGHVRAGPILLATRPMAVGLVAYGLVGIALAAILVVALGPADAFGLGRIDTERQAVADLVASGEATASDTRGAVDRAGGSVAAGAQAAEDAAGFARELSAALRQLESALHVELLGTRPLESAAADVEQAATKADAAADGLDHAATQARTGAEGLADLERDLGIAAARMTALREGLSATGASGSSVLWLRILLIALIVWLGLPAVFSLWLGLRIWRRAG